MNKFEHTIKLIRHAFSNYGTEGRLWTEWGYICCTLELPWRNNECNISCIPCGTYIVVPYHSKRFGACYHVTGVDGRTWILFHSGNLAGDTSMGFKTHSAGCILVGKYHGVYAKQRAVMCSKPAMRALREFVGDSSFRLIVENRP